MLFLFSGQGFTHLNNVEVIHFVTIFGQLCFVKCNEQQTIKIF